MTTQFIPSPIRLISLLLGLGLLFIGARFLLAPEVGEAGFGLHYQEPNYAFHYIKGIRDIFSGLLVVVFAWSHYRTPLFLTLLAGSLVPLTDMFIVWSTPDSNLWAMFIHGSTAITLWVLCYFLRPAVRTGPVAHQQR